MPPCLCCKKRKNKSTKLESADPYVILSDERSSDSINNLGPKYTLSNKKHRKDSLLSGLDEIESKSY